MHVEIKRDANRKENICYLPYQLIKELELNPQTRYKISLGLETEETFFRGIKIENPILNIPQILFEDIELEGYSLNIWKKNDSIHLGPVIGVFLNTRHIEDMDKGEVSYFIHNHNLASNDSYSLSYFFSINDIDWKQKKINGYISRGDKWKKCLLPMPNVLYDRGASFKENKKLLVIHIRDQFKTHSNIKFINNKDYLGKWELYKVLSRIPDIQDHIPDTIKYTDFSDVESMLEKQRYIFLKSYYGSRGFEVMSISKESDGYNVNYFQGNLQFKKIKDNEELKECVHSFIKDKLFIIQQGIKSIQYQKRNFDIRTLMIKDKIGQWKAIYNHINLAKADSTITTISGDYQYAYQNIYSKIQSSTTIIPSEKQINNLGIQFSKAIEKNFGSFGEIGLDIIIDSRGKIWFIEANSKPEKHPGPGITYTEKATSPYISTISYAKFLTMGIPKINKLSSWKVTIKKMSNYNLKKTVTIPKQIYDQLRKNQPIILKIGMTEYSINCESNSTDKIIEFSYDILEAFDGLLDIKTNLKIENSTIQLGPVVGVFISNGNIRKMKLQNPKFRQIENVKANKYSDTILYFFSIKDVKFIHNKIYGMYFHEKENAWRRLSYPFPDVLYDRGGGVLSNQIVKSDYIREQFSSINNIKTINPEYNIDKWHSYFNLKMQREMQLYLPTTVLYKGIDTLIDMFSQYSKIYLKDRNGSNGRGIIRVIMLSENTYEYSYEADTKLYEKKVNKLDDIVSVINNLFPNKDIIVQNAINLITFGDRNIDFRATVQRNGEGELDITSYPARVGASRFPITSSRTGADIYQFESFFEKHYNYSPEQIKTLKDKIDQFIYTCYISLEKIYGTFGEIGIDFAIDWNEKLWFIEGNAKPGYDSMYNSYDKETIKRTFINPLEYAKYICQF